MTKRTNLLTVIGAGVFTLSGAAIAQDSVVIYGKLYPQLTHVTTSGATPAGTPVSTLSAPPTGTNFDRNELAASDSWMGFRGTESLGGKLRAFWQIEGNVAVDSGSSQFANRNTHVGLSGGAAPCGWEISIRHTSVRAIRSVSLVSVHATTSPT